MNALYTLNIKHAKGFNAPFVSDRVRRSMLAACFRWGCNYAEINHDPEHGEDAICNWGKILGPRLMSPYEKLLYLDGDVIISDHAPNPFDLCVADDTIYAVTDAQGVNPNPAWEACIYNSRVDEMIARYPDWTRPEIPRYFNTGVMLFRNTPAIRDAFDFVGECREFHSLQCYDQTVINMVMHNRVKVEMLPEAWNYIVWAREPDPNAFINHYAHAGPTL